MFETHYNEEMEAEVKRLEAQQRAIGVGHPEWDNACKICGCRIAGCVEDSCEQCRRAAGVDNSPQRIV